jgi:colicin import membrane protein
MRENKGTPVAVVLSAVLHLGIVGFLALAILPCSFYEGLFDKLHLPASWNPITCAKPLELPGQIIEATLIGPTGAPPPKAAKAKPSAPAIPPPPSVPPPPPLTPPDIKTLPPPPEHPDIKDQEKVVADALEKAQDAKREQEEKQRQRQAELDAQAAKKKEEQKKLDELFAKMDAAAAARQKAENRANQAKQQLEDLKDARDDGEADLPRAAQRQTGTNGADTGLEGQYKAAIQNAVTQNWLRPDNMPDVSCVVHIVQIPGGDVVSAKVDAGCPYDEAGRRSIENAVLRAQPLPYKGFESVFRRTLDFTFRPQ